MTSVGTLTEAVVAMMRSMSSTMIIIEIEFLVSASMTVVTAVSTNAESVVAVIATMVVLLTKFSVLVRAVLMTVSLTILVVSGSSGAIRVVADVVAAIAAMAGVAMVRTMSTISTVRFSAKDLIATSESEFEIVFVAKITEADTVVIIIIMISVLVMALVVAVPLRVLRARLITTSVSMVSTMAVTVAGGAKATIAWTSWVLEAFIIEALIVYSSIMREEITEGMALMQTTIAVLMMMMLG